MSLQQKNSHVRDQRVSFDEPLHKYYLEGNEVGTSVTTFLHKLFPEFDGKKIAENIKNYKYGKITYNRYKDMNVDEILEKWSEDGKKSFT